MEKRNFIKFLRKLDACPEAVAFAGKFATSQQAWDACEQGDWMLWLLGKMASKPESKSRKKLVLTACKCARLTLKYVPKNERRPLRAIQTAEAWAKGKKGITLDEVRTAADAAYAAAYTAYAVAYTAYTAAYTACTAYTPNAAASATANTAADTAANAANTAADAANAKTKTLKKCADIVRKDYPKLIIKTK